MKWKFKLSLDLELAIRLRSSDFVDIQIVKRVPKLTGKMPTASSKTLATAAAPQMPDLLQEPIKNMVCVLDKKLRNLEKRKVIKLP